MSLSWNDIRDNAISFQERWKDAKDERAEAQMFVYELLRDVYGVDPRRVATFETKVHPTHDTNGYIDMLWPGRILIEMKSRGKSLDKAHDQARKYAFAIKSDDDLPEYIMVSDFARIRLYHLATNRQWEFETSNLSDNVQLLSVLTNQASAFDLIVDKELNTQAAAMMACLHDELAKNRYTGHSLELYLVRILFCLFADHTGIFPKRHFHRYIAESKDDGSDLAGRIMYLFELLDTKPDNRMPNLTTDLAAFPYINGGLFREVLRSASFTREMRSLLLECCEFNWATISPAIFGAMFQNVMDQSKRRLLGEYYTPQHIIRKVIRPLFVNALYSEYEQCKTDRVKLEQFYEKLSSITILDPACGCGNFLIVAYMELRRLELLVLRSLYPSNDSLPHDFSLEHVLKVNVGQFYGIEIEEFPCQIARTSMWLIDHKMNCEASREFARSFKRIPLEGGVHITYHNALDMDWNDTVSNSIVNYIIGNPPYTGAKKLKEKRSEMNAVFKNHPKTGTLDYVAAWFLKAADFMQGTHIKAAFVATTSIVQGEQVATLWKPLLFEKNVIIEFAHKPFKWTSEAKDANVHCVILGFKAFEDNKTKYIFDEDDSSVSPPIINPYLDGLPEITLIVRRKKPLCHCPEIHTGNKPIDGGNYLFTDGELADFLAIEPNAQKWIKPWYGSEEMLAKKPRYCLWVGECPPDELARMPHVRHRIDAVRDYRNRSSDQGTRKLASKPRNFHIEYMPKQNYLVIPEVSSENRKYIPMAFMTPDVLCSNLVKLLPGASLYDFGILTSSMHMLWLKSVCGRLEGRIRYSIEVVYNNFPWPNTTPKQREKIEKLAKEILDIREKYAAISYKILYNDDSMPTELATAHQRLDAAVMKLYNLSTNASDEACIIELYRRYRSLSSAIEE